MIQLFINEYINPGDIILSTCEELTKYVKHIYCTVIVQSTLDNGELPFDDDTFDIVIYDEKVSKLEIDRVLKRNGKSFLQK